MPRQDKAGLAKHTSRQFDAELEHVRERVLAMGGLVEQQITDAVQALIAGDSAQGEAVISKDARVNRMQVDIDEDCTRILALRAPQAGDLRLVLAITKTVTDLERIGDEAEKIGRMATQLASFDRPRSMFHHFEMLSKHVCGMLRDVLNAFARLDSKAALQVTLADDEVDQEYETTLRQGITFMMEDPRTIRHVFNTLWAVKALERIGDHATNIGENVVYFVEGKDVRHLAPEEREQELAEPRRR
ncbi:MAG TPA: phosphate signaling complex protein PhoU [Salinisphaeraceae bacterium]|nr:phosphate signaling complex protein PhoU [Salinisphaeraceae bacterium]